ncbi:unnamed protein product [Paramecium octaurelia]|uniref:Uncharacterized protein n=1 Tax=Paramecium octaurelia TaxID=43137 RepID=A0A8S1SS66_PAROT|nr:unnamed protein product [Paramecium octaurelia]
MNASLQSETLCLTQYDKSTQKRNSYQDEDLQDFQNAETITITKYSKNTDSSSERESYPNQTLNLTNLSKNTPRQPSHTDSQITLSLTLMTKLTQEDSINQRRRSI